MTAPSLAARAYPQRVRKWETGLTKQNAGYFAAADYLSRYQQGERKFRKMETTDGVFVKIDSSHWWDTRGITIVPEWIVYAYLNVHRNVGIVVTKPAFLG
jgi:hypothetical protein